VPDGEYVYSRSLVIGVIESMSARRVHETGNPSVAGDEHLGLLLRTLAQVAISVDLQPTLRILLDSLNELVPFDAGGIFVNEPGREIVRARATRGYASDLEMPGDTGIVGDVMRIGEPRLLPDVSIDATYLAARPSTAAQLTVPLISARSVLGAISLESDRASAFDEHDLALVSLFAQQATVVIERSILHEQSLRQSRLDREIEIAAEILRGMTPAVAPALSGLQVFGRSLLAESVGGDAFDFVSYPDSQIGLSIADAKGKGLPAALLAVAHRAMLHSLVGVELRLRATFSRISDLLARSLPAGNFVTTFYGILDIPERRMVYANAGHPPPLIVRVNGTIDSLAVTGPALGFPRAAPMREGYAAFERGDGLVLFTDGVTDVGPSPDAFFDATGVAQTVRALWEHTATDVCNGLLDEVTRRAGGNVPDDATVVVAKFE
jgi:serine phosphatase RsbU (regulator of sigma subunit)